MFSLSSLWLRPTLQGSRGQVTRKSTSLESKSGAHQYVVLRSILQWDGTSGGAHNPTLIWKSLHTFKIMAIIGSTQPQKN